ncbi:MAG: hypothetical protein M4579_004722 [Chaenotheca gracillima]|nr:MAG: hypothetical protein M4579_004722 [Chaenotheca gracillima]
MSGPTWQDIAEAACKHRDDTIAQITPPVPELPPAAELPLDVTGLPRQLLTAQEDAITKAGVEDLVFAMAEGRLSATEVTGAFLRRAGLAQKLVWAPFGFTIPTPTGRCNVNCVTELLGHRALTRAKLLDEYMATHNKPVGPLHGLPISVKEHIGMKGLDLNAGFVAWVGTVAEEDAHILKILWEAGCVFYVRTTQPQTVMHLETSNNLYGVTVNPYNRGLTSGGSSGGEGALMGLRGSCLGIGTDIGGSIRNPAALNGVYGLRPTSYRLPMEGLTFNMGGNEQIVPVVGPLSTSLAGIKLFMKVLLDAKPWVTEPSLVPLPWRDDVSHLRRGPEGVKLRVGVMWNDGVVKPHPPVIRALKEVAEKLRRVAGVEVVDWQPYKHDLAWEIIASLYFADGGQEETAAIEASGEPWRPLSKWILKENPYVKHQTISEVWDWTDKREHYRRDYARVWNNTASTHGSSQPADGSVDVLLCPAAPGAAPPFDCSKYWGYTSQWNLLDYPALAFPVTRADPAVDLREDRYEPLNDKDRANWELYEEPERYRGAPVSLQLVGRRYEDEKVVEAMEFINQQLRLPFAPF